jgi:hypothetical protein
MRRGRWNTLRGGSPVERGGRRSQEHPSITRDRLREMRGDGADASEASRVLMRHEPVSARRAAVGQDAPQVFEPPRDEVVHHA